MLTGPARGGRSWAILCLTLSACSDYGASGASATTGSTEAADAFAMSAEAPEMASTAKGAHVLFLADTKGWVDRLAKWDNPRIAVCWESTTAGFEREKEWIRDSLKQSWEAASAVHFDPILPCTPRKPGIHVTFEDSAARTLALGKHLDTVDRGLLLNPYFGSWNQWCKETAAKRESCFRANAVHEFGHALGFAHEHNRPDLPGGCNIAPDDIVGNDELTPDADPYSVMNYCTKDRMLQSGRLSKGDRDSVEMFYGNEF